MFLLLHFCPISLGHPRASGYCSHGERLHSGRDPKIQDFRISGEEPGKQKPRSAVCASRTLPGPRAQELSRSRAQGKERRKWKMDRSVQLASGRTGAALGGMRGHYAWRSHWTEVWRSWQVGTCFVPSRRGSCPQGGLVVGTVRARGHRQRQGQAVDWACGIQRGRSRAEAASPTDRWPGSGSETPTTGSMEGGEASADLNFLEPDLSGAGSRLGQQLGNAL